MNTDKKHEISIHSNHRLLSINPTKATNNPANPIGSTVHTHIAEQIMLTNAAP